MRGEDNFNTFTARETGRRLRHLGFRYILPSTVTVLALAAGATAIRFALDARFEAAMLAIVVAAVLDGIDGSIARFLKAPTKFGAELDSLSDVVSFGVAPAVLLYLWALKGLQGGGWIIALAFIVCCALRLARFNSRLEDDDEPRRKAGFLTGIPAPVGAGLAIVPIMLWAEYGEGLFSQTNLVAAYSAAICLGMVSKIPTYSFRTLLIRREYLVHLLLLVGLFAAALTAYGWVPLIVLGAFYWLSVPVSWYRFRRLRASREPFPLLGRRALGFVAEAPTQPLGQKPPLGAADGAPRPDVHWQRQEHRGQH
jgi:CDP-diacylglycerol---serine O-phosphatidyltransferase